MRKFFYLQSKPGLEHINKKRFIRKLFLTCKKGLFNFPANVVFNKLGYFNHKKDNDDLITLANCRVEKKSWWIFWERFHITINFNSIFLKKNTGFELLADNAIHELVHACQRIDHGNSCCMSEINFNCKPHNSMNAELAVDHAVDNKMKLRIFRSMDIFKDLEKEYMSLWK